MSKPSTFFRANSIPVDMVDVETRGGRHLYKRKTGYGKIPLLYVGKQMIQGFNAIRYREMSFSAVGARALTWAQKKHSLPILMKTESEEW